MNPIVNALVDERFEDAIKEAKEADEFIRSGSMSVEEIKIQKPLLGVPFTAKEEIAAKGKKKLCSLTTYVLNLFNISHISFLRFKLDLRINLSERKKGFGRCEHFTRFKKFWRHINRCYEYSGILLLV